MGVEERLIDGEGTVQLVTVRVSAGHWAPVLCLGGECEEVGKKLHWRNS